MTGFFHEKKIGGLCISYFVGYIPGTYYFDLDALERPARKKTGRIEQSAKE